MGNFMSLSSVVYISVLSVVLFMAQLLYTSIHGAIWSSYFYCKRRDSGPYERVASTAALCQGQGREDGPCLCTETNDGCGRPLLLCSSTLSAIEGIVGEKNF